MKIVLIGADGQLGSDLKKDLKGHEVFPLYYPEFDITKPHLMKKVLLELSPEIIINTAAYNRVDECEDKPGIAFKVNAIGVHNLVQLCLKMNAALVHFSTDYVFDGKKKRPYTEKDAPNPLGVYGNSKLSGELFIRNNLEKFYLIRTCGLYGLAGCWGKGTNFVDSVAALAKKGERLRVVYDQTVTPTSTAELSQRVCELIQLRRYGLYHLTNEGECTWHEFASAIVKTLGEKCELIPVDSQTYGSKARRPAYSVLENAEAKKIGLTPFSPWKDALYEYLKSKGYLN